MKYTIIITVYNKEKYIKRCIDSVFDQSYRNFELLVVNDGSTDDSASIIVELQKKYDFTYYSKKNTGVSDTRNFAISKVETDYFMFLDADDYLANDLLSIVDQYSDYDVLSFNAVNVDENGNHIKNLHKPSFSGCGINYLEMLFKLKSMFTVPWGYVYNTDFFRSNHFEYPKGMILEDFYLTPFIIAEAKKLISINYLGYYYVDNANGIINGDKDLISKTCLELYDMMISRIDSSWYDNFMKKKFKSFVSGVLIWQGGNLSCLKRKEYVCSLKKKHVLDNIRPLFKRFVLKILFFFDLYYFLVKIIKK